MGRRMTEGHEGVQVERTSRKSMTGSTVPSHTPKVALLDGPCWSNPTGEGSSSWGELQDIKVAT